MAPTSPTLVVRLVTTYDDVTRRADLQITGSRGVVHETDRQRPGAPFRVAETRQRIR